MNNFLWYWQNARRRAAARKHAARFPSIQNIPIRSELGRKILQGCMASGRSFIEYDYTGGEMKIAAEMAAKRRRP